VTFVYPVHPNPNVRARSRAAGSRDNVCLVDPLGYVDLVAVMKRSILVLGPTRVVSGEAPSFGVPWLVLRDVTERPRVSRRAWRVCDG